MGSSRPAGGPARGRALDGLWLSALVAFVVVLSGRAGLGLHRSLAGEYGALGAPHEVLKDYKPMAARRRARTRRLPWFAAGLGLPLLAIALISLQRGPAPAATAAAEPPPAMPAELPSAPVEIPGDAAAVATAPDGGTGPAPAAPEAQPASPDQVLTVGRGDSLDRMFKRHGLDRGDLAQVMQLDLARKYLRLIRPGDEIRVQAEAGSLQALTRDVSLTESLQVSRDEAGKFTASMLPRELERRQVRASGEIRSSLFEAAAEAGVSDRTIMNLAGIFAWDIDFVLDIRQGDRFNVVYEELWRDGKRVGEGQILAAEFINQGEDFQAVRYEDPATGEADYYTPAGRSLRKAFVRAPVAFSRISSNFNPSRRHPKLNTIRAHKGVDYAAPTGTPVKAAGDGKVIFRGRKGGYGNVVILQHGGNITTLYAHLSRFAKAGNGARVRQGQVIGYVGATGLATGPHLHYEYRVNGVHMNPRTVKLPDAEPIAPERMAAFQAVAARLLQQLKPEPTLAANPAAGATT